MTVFKKFGALVAAGVLGIQLIGVGAAFAKTQKDGECDFGNNDLEITIGNISGSHAAGFEPGDVELSIDGDGHLVCTWGTSSKTDDAPASSIDSITVEMDDDDSTGWLIVYLDDDEGTGDDASEWPEFDTFDIAVTTRVQIDGSSVDEESANRLHVTVGAKTVAFSGTEATSTAPTYQILGGDGGDTVDASKSAARIIVDGGDGSDTIKGGSGKDSLVGGSGTSSAHNVDVIYGNGGNDYVECSGEGENSAAFYSQGWGGSGDDFIKDCNVVAPGLGNDDIENNGSYAPSDCTPPSDASDADDTLAIVSYADVTTGVEWTSTSDGTSTAGGAGEDLFDAAPYQFNGSQGDDVVVDSTSSSVSGLGGDDLIKVAGDGVDCEANDGVGTVVLGGAGNDVITEVTGLDAVNVFFGGAGNDILRGKGGDDGLYGGPGKDQAWGGPGSDTCGGEVTNRCEFVRR